MYRQMKALRKTSRRQSGAAMIEYIALVGLLALTAIPVVPGVTGTMMKPLCITTISLDGAGAPTPFGAKQDGRVYWFRFGALHWDSSNETACFLKIRLNGKIVLTQIKWQQQAF